MAILALSACGGGRDFRPVSDVPVRIGPPYTVRGTTYTPAADAAYDRVGYATWYGPESGNQTANGERFRPDGIYENEYVREGGQWKIRGVTVTMTFYAALERARIWFPSAPPSEAFPPDAPSQPVDQRLGRQFNPWHFAHPITGEALPVPVSGPAATDD